MEGKCFNVKRGNIIVGPQGITLETEQDDREKQWYKIAVPHLSLMVSNKYEERGLVPMVKIAEEVEWIPISCPKVFTSRDGTYIPENRNKLYKQKKRKTNMQSLKEAQEVSAVFGKRVLRKMRSHSG